MMNNDDDENDDDPELDVPFVGDMVNQSNTIALLHHWQQLRHRASVTTMVGSGAATFVGLPPTVLIEPVLPDVSVGVGLIVLAGSKTDEGQLITAVGPAYHHILSSIDADPAALNKLSWRAFEEVIAARYRERGGRVTLTPRSGDGGVDIIVDYDDLKSSGLSVSSFK